MYFKNNFKYSFIISLSFIICVLMFSNLSAAKAPPTAEFDIYAIAESFTWKEFDNGSQLLKEDGQLYGAGISVKANTYKSVTLNARFEMFEGSIDYDGQTWGGTSITTDADYVGGRTEFDVGWRFIIKDKCAIEPFAGLGGRWWSRDIQPTSLSLRSQEDWTSYYGRAGVRGSHNFNDDLKVFAEVAVKLPIDNMNKADLGSIGLGTVTIDPGNEVSFFAEAGLKWKLLKVSIFYEGLRFSESDPERAATNLLVFQPKSEADIFGVNAGVSF